MDVELYQVYVTVDGDNNVAAINSSAFLADTSGWTQIDEGEGDRYHHAQGHYLDGPVFTDTGIPAYKLVDGAVVSRTAEEIAAALSSLPVPPPSPEDRIADLEAQDALLTDTIDSLLTVILPGIMG